MTSRPTAWAQAEVGARISSLVEEPVRRGRPIGLAVGVVAPGLVRSWGFGRLRREGEAVPTGDTVFEIGSVTKVFTTALLALMAQEGVLGLEDPVRAHLPGRLKLPDWREREVTLAHLATHTSTLPRVSLRLAWKSLRNPRNPYAGYRLEDLYADLASFRPGRKLGRKFRYSNLGMGLLGHILALRSGGSYETLVRERICRPLSMTDTTISLSEEQRSRLAQGHRLGKPAPLWDIPAIPGAGALRSTMNDLLKFVTANLGLTATGLEGALRATHAPRVRVSHELAIGLGWHVTPAPSEPGLVWHQGSTGGFRSFLGFVREKGVGAVLLANSAGDLEALGKGLLSLLG